MNILDTSDPGKAANVAARAAILYATVCGFNAENDIRKTRGEAMAYDQDCYAAILDDCFPEWTKDPTK
jgi:hypothetical protein